jgi:hypothetical protein
MTRWLPEAIDPTSKEFFLARAVRGVTTVVDSMNVFITHAHPDNDAQGLGSEEFKAYSWTWRIFGDPKALGRSLNKLKAAGMLNERRMNRLVEQANEWTSHTSGDEMVDWYSVRFPIFSGLRSIYKVVPNEISIPSGGPYGEWLEKLLNDSLFGDVSDPVIPYWPKRILGISISDPTPVMYVARDGTKVTVLGAIMWTVITLIAVYLISMFVPSLPLGDVLNIVIAGNTALKQRMLFKRVESIDYNVDTIVRDYVTVDDLDDIKDALSLISAQIGLKLSIL